MKIKMATPQTQKRYIDEKEAAAILGFSIKTLQQYRFRDRGPRFRRLGGRAVRYAVEDLYKWIESQPVGGEQPVEAA